MCALIAFADDERVIKVHREIEEKGGLVLRNVNRNVADIIKLTGFDAKLNIEKD